MDISLIVWFVKLKNQPTYWSEVGEIQGGGIRIFQRALIKKPAYKTLPADIIQIGNLLVYLTVQFSLYKTKNNIYINYLFKCQIQDQIALDLQITITYNPYPGRSSPSLVRTWYNLSSGIRMT